MTRDPSNQRDVPLHPADAKPGGGAVSRRLFVSWLTGAWVALTGVIAPAREALARPVNQGRPGRPPGTVMTVAESTPWGTIERHHRV